MRNLIPLIIRLLFCFSLCIISLLSFAQNSDVLYQFHLPSVSYLLHPGKFNIGLLEDWPQVPSNLGLNNQDYTTDEFANVDNGMGLCFGAGIVLDNPENKNQFEISYSFISTNAIPRANGNSYGGSMFFKPSFSDSTYSYSFSYGSFSDNMLSLNHLRRNNTNHKLLIGYGLIFGSSKYSISASSQFVANPLLNTSDTLESRLESTRINCLTGGGTFLAVYNLRSQQYANSFRLRFELSFFRSFVNLTPIEDYNFYYNSGLNWWSDPVTFAATGPSDAPYNYFGPEQLEVFETQNWVPKTFIVSGSLSLSYVFGYNSLASRNEKKVRLDKVPLDKVPPKLKIENVEFIDSNNDDKINAFETSMIKFDLVNSGQGYAAGLIAKIIVSGNKSGINIERKIKLDKIKAGKSKTISIPISTNRNTENGSAIISVDIIEPKGFHPVNSPLELQVSTTAFISPNLEVVDFETTSKWEPGKTIPLILLVQNTGQGLAEDISVELSTDNSIYFSPEEKQLFKEIQPGDAVSLSYDIMIPRSCNKSELEIECLITERFDNYGQSWKNTFKLESIDAVERVVINSNNSESQVKINRASFEDEHPSEIRVNVDTTLVQSSNISKVAVIGKQGVLCNGSIDNGQNSADIIQSELIGLYGVVERKYLEDILEEQRLGMSGLILEDEDLARAGCLAGAQGTVLVNYGCVKSKTKLNIILVDCSTAEVYWSATSTGNNVDEYELIDAIKAELKK